MTRKKAPEQGRSSARARASHLGARVMRACGVQPAAEPPTILSTAEVLSREYRAIWGGRDTFSSEAEYYRAVHARDQAALCLSGGGIRSAAFALGALQALASRGLLARFHYLSTVSGGGYIGSWLWRWILAQGNDAAGVERRLADSRSRDVPQITALRANSNYLTPKVGIASTDTWTAVVLSIRNILINWSIFLPAVLLVALLPNLYELAMRRMAGAEPNVALLLLGLAWLLLLVAIWSSCHFLPSHHVPPVNKSMVMWLITVPALTWAALAPLVIADQRFHMREHVPWVAWDA